MWNAVRLLSAGLILSLAGLSARADTLHLGETASVTLVGTGLGATISFHYGTTWITDFAGEYKWQPAAGSNNPWPLNQPFTSFCVDLNEYIRLNNTYNYVLKSLESSPYPDPQTSNTGMGTDRANALRRLWGTDRADVTTNVKAAAFQMAIWEIVFEYPASAGLPLSSMNVTGGNFYMDVTDTDSTKQALWQSIANQANAYLAAAWAPTAKYEPMLAVMSLNGAQDQLVVMPLPASACGGAVLFGALAALRTARRRPTA